MLGRLTTAVIGLAGLVVAGLGVASATVWRADDVLRATVTADAPYLLTAPGVLEMGGSPTTVTITAPDNAPVVLAVGREADVKGWLGEDPYEVITGLSDWHDLAVRKPSASPSPSEATVSEEATASEEAAETQPTAEGVEPAPETVEFADPAGSDMWVLQSVGKGKATLTWSSSDTGRWSLLAASPSGETPTVQLAWPREVTTPWLYPGLAVGALLLIAAAYLEVRGRIAKRRGSEASVKARLHRIRNRREPVDSESVVDTPASGVPTTAVEPEHAGSVATTGDMPGHDQELPTRPRPARQSWLQPPAAPEPERPVLTQSALTEPVPVAAARPPAWATGSGPGNRTGSDSAAQFGRPTTVASADQSRPPLEPPGQRPIFAPVTGQPPAPGRPITPVQQTGPNRPGTSVPSRPVGSGQPGPEGAHASQGGLPVDEQPAVPARPVGGWVPGRGGRQPQSAPVSRPVGGESRPAWLGRGRPVAAPPPTGPIPAVSSESGAPRLSTESRGIPQVEPPAPDGPTRADAWRRTWGIGEGTDEGTRR